MNPKTPTWQPAGPEGLYLNTWSGTYYSRYRMNGTRTFRALKTKVFSVAKLKHAKRNVDVEKDRQRGARLDGDFHTLGGLLVEMKARLAETPVAENTPIGRNSNIERLQTNWQRGDFSTFRARNVTADVGAELREFLLHHAEWKWKFQKGKHRGFKVPVVNQTLWVLRVLLDLAVEKRVLIENPFAVSSTLRGGLPSLRNHDLRHFFASVCIASGVDIPTVSRWLGHADGGALAMKTYGHLQKDQSQASAKKVNFNAPSVDARPHVAG